MNPVTSTYGYPTIQEFLGKFNAVAAECSVDGVTVASHHPILTSVTVRSEDYQDSFNVVGIDVQQMPGCGCWSGVEIVIKKRD